MKTNIAGTAVEIIDLHYPLHHKPTVEAAFDFIGRNKKKIKIFIFGGDQLDNIEISHHTKGKPLYRERAAYKRNMEGFKRDILDPLEEILPNDCLKIWIIGNHERFEADLIEEHPEYEGTIDHVEQLQLIKRGWNVIPLGHFYKNGRLSYCHGEWLTGIGNQAGQYPSKKLVETVAGNCVAGHTHASQSFTRISPINQEEKWMGWILPCACKVNPAYIRNRPTAWVNGFGITEFMEDGTFNQYPVVVTRGRCIYGGIEYGKKQGKTW